MFFLDRKGLVLFIKLLKRYGGKEVPSHGGLIEIEFNPNNSSIVARPGTDISGDYAADVIPEFPQVKIWVDPDLEIPHQDIFFKFFPCLIRGREWVEIKQVFSVDTKLYVLAWQEENC